jgi:predicted cupin superfamily sugar epimerase
MGDGPLDEVLLAVRGRAAADWIRELSLAPHPEGGFFREAYRCAESLPRAALPTRYTGDRACSTAIYYLLCHPQVSRFHRIRSDEVWHHYDGDPLLIHVLTPAAECRCLRLGCAGEGFEPQAVVLAGSWFAAEVAQPGGYALAGCTVAPGFDFDDFEMAGPDRLLSEYPHCAALIRRFA